MGLKDKFRRLINMFLPSPLVASLIRWRIMYPFFSKLPLNHYQYPDPYYKTTKLHGITVRLNLHDYMGWHLFYNFEDHVLDMLKKEIKEGDTVYDVGGNIGFIALLSAKLAGITGYVYSFEPNPSVIKEFKNNLSLNSITNVNLIEYAVGSNEGILPLSIIDPYNLGRSTLNRQPGNQTMQQVDVKVITLDSFARENAARKPDLLKIDVEGFEFEVLKGAEKIIDQWHPRIIIEIDHDNLAANHITPTQVLDFLAGKQYEFYFMGENGERVVDYASLPKHVNLLCIYQL